MVLHKIKNQILFVLLLMLSFELIGQKGELSLKSKSDKSFLIQSGFGNILINDPVASPLNYDGIFFPLFIEFNIGKKLHKNSFSLFLLKNQLNSNISENNIHSIENLSFAINYKYLHQICKFSKMNSILNFGFNFNTTSNIRMHRIAINTTNNNGDLFAGINLAANFEWEITKHSKLTDEIQYTLIKYLIYRSYSIHFPPEGYSYQKLKEEEFDANLLINGDFIFPLQFIDFNNTLTYELKTGNKTNVQISYMFRFFQYNRYKDFYPVKYGMNSLLIGFKFRF